MTAPKPSKPLVRTREKALAEARLTKAKGTVYTARNRPIEADEIVSADNVCEDWHERAYDLVGEAAEDYPSLTSEQMERLEKLLADFVRECCPPEMWAAEDVEEHA